MSGERIAYLEPQERLWRGETGFAYNLEKHVGTDTLKPFDGIEGFDKSVINYKKTLFRFPLRDTKSDISEDIFTIERLQALIEPLEKEAEYLLLFLRSVLTVEVFNISKSGLVEHLFAVNVAQSCQTSLTKTRLEFLQQLKKLHHETPYRIAESITSVVKFSIVITDRNKVESSSSWLVANQVGTDNEEILDSAAKQHVFPLVGVALQLHEQNTLTIPLDSHSRLFCFLPMPVDVTSPLPVHVHGTFGLSDNRRAIKWPTGEMKNDLAAKWNHTLISNLLPTCYNLLLKEGKEHVTPELFYQALPCIESTFKDNNWRLLLEPFFVLLFQWECFWANMFKKWVGIQHAIIVADDDPVNEREVVLNVLTKCGLTIAHLPRNIIKALNAYCDSKVRVVSPALCRLTLFENISSYAEESYDDKLDLLQYCLLELDGTFCVLWGLELLPLADHSFINFTTSIDKVAKSRYICTEQFPKTLLPSLERRLVDVQDIKPELHSQLLQVAESKQTQLQLLTSESVAQLLPKCYPEEWKDAEIVELLPSEADFSSEWFTLLWNCISQCNLSLFENLLVVPLSSPSSKKITYVTRLRKVSKSSVVLASDCSYSKRFLTTLNSLGVHCTGSVDILKHDQLSEFINTFDTVGVLNAISNSTEEISNVKLKMEEAVEVQSFLASHLQNRAILERKPQLLHTLKCLCIFIVLNNNEVPVSLQNIAQVTWKSQVILEPQDFHFSHEFLPHNLILLSLRNEKTLIDLLKNTIVTPRETEDFILDCLVPFISSNSSHDCGKVDLLMEEVLRIFPALKKKDIVSFRKLADKLASLPFLLTEEESKVRMSPETLYDPSKKELKSVLHGRPVFPIKQFATDQHLIESLRECRIQTIINGEMIIRVLTENATDYHSNPVEVSQEVILRLKALISYIDDHRRDLLDKDTFLSRALTDLSCNKYWLPVLAKPPKHYPTCLVWKGSSCPCHVASHKASNTVLCDDDDITILPFIVGSEMFVCCCPPTICKLFVNNVSVTVIIERVLAHFQHVTKNLCSFDTLALDSLVHKVYSYLSSHLQELKKVFPGNELCVQQLIWIKKSHKFLTPNIMFVNENSSFEHSLHLSPYFEHVPEILQEENYIKLFDCFGVHAELTDSDVISVLKKIKEDKCEKVTTKQAWKIVEHILNWLTEAGTTSVIVKFNPPEVSDQLLVPIEGSLEEWPCLMPVQEVVYTDLDYLKSFGEKDTVFIHDMFSSLAPYLGVKSLSKHLDISDDAFGDVGQHEPLVTRLKNILKDYKGGLTIIKELLQNADDAGATELTICYDARLHRARPKSLIFPGMADCHGPALLVHNNASFTDEDFENITKLAGATKMNKPLKIGKFGVGFCSVYHITDIPSFISGKWLYIFDPTISYLNKVITDPTKPGKRISFTERAVSYSSQLVPYENLFGFSKNTEYNETLFRFPFRSSPSDISTVVYSESQIKDLADEIQKVGSKLLLFLSNVKRITFSRIDNGMNEPSKICVIEKTEISSISTRENNDSFVNLVQIDVSTYQQPEPIKTCELWILSTNRIGLSDPRRLCDGSVACLLKVLDTGRYLVEFLSHGEMFCYLPLSVQTGLPVHVSANFAVLNDRTGIHKSDSDNPTEEVQWNVQLMQTVIPRAYFLLLSAIQQLCISGKITIERDYKFYLLWPLCHQLKFHNPFDHMVLCLYDLLADSELFYSPCQSKWLKLSNTSILSDDILSVPPSPKSPPKCVVEVCEKLQYPLIYLPSTYLSCLPKQIVKICTINEHQFIESFFNNLVLLPVGVRNEVLLLIFKAFTLQFKEHIKSHLETKECIPCSPDGKKLKKCQSIIDPCASFSDLYDKDDRMFPLDKFHQDPIVHTSLQTLGIIRDNLPWPLIIERANSILPLYQSNPQKAIKRSERVIKCISQHDASNKITPSELKSIPFLPVMKKPTNDEYPECFHWCGQDQTLLCGKVLVKSGSNLQLAGSQVCFLNELDPERGGCGPVTNVTAERLGIKLQPSLGEVVGHLCHIKSLYTAEDTEQAVEYWVESACELIYKHMEQSLVQNPLCANDFSILKSSKSIWTGSEFVAPSSVAKSWKLDGPILFGIPHSLKLKEQLIRVLEIQEKFSTVNLLDCLCQLHDQHKGNCIDGRAFTTAVCACKILGINPVSESVCHLPDENQFMAKASELVYNDAPWCKLDEECATVHEDIPRRVALNLGVMPIRSKALQQYESQSQTWGGVEFGQHEKLTQRIRNILSQYPGDVTILKELLQNADDAKATKMYIILDKRQHRAKQLPSDDWKDLQGPALLVWNDRGFSDDDFNGIQKLGLGSKRSDTESIGQFGIGFNVVYHLTDCPSFLSNGNTLCVLDPHCRYVPGATTLNPGRRYDGIDKKFWDRLCDLKPTYLLNGEDLSGCPKEVNANGTLFRFPLRHTRELVEKSELVDRSEEESHSTSLFGSSSTPLDPERMQRYLKQWAPKMKEALLFLNSVSELKFFVIHPGMQTSMTLTHSYSVQCDGGAMSRKKLFLENVKSFTKNCQPGIVQYPICMNEEKPNHKSEKWLIQQGIGDIQNSKQIWHYQQVKPKHGIAINLTGRSFVGKVFCFLPLPAKSRLPVHVNGNFILDAARSGLWKSRDTNADDKQKWNQKLIKAIASSYAEFLVTCQNDYFTTEMGCLHQPKEMISKYYSIFPVWLDAKDTMPEGEMMDLANEVYLRLDKSNSSILVAMFSSTIQWLPLHNRLEPSKQVHFMLDGHKFQHLPKVLSKIGVHLTEAPLFIRDHFEDAGISLPIANPKTVYEYYCLYYKQVSQTFPTFISDTKFESVQNFLVFLRYLLRPMQAHESESLNIGNFKTFPELPYDVPLLLTADENLCMFSQTSKVICSTYSHIFSVNVRKHFAHPEVHNLKLNPEYFIREDDDNCWEVICAVLDATVPTVLKLERVINAGKHVSIEKFVIPIWNCLGSDPVFMKHFRSIVERWALLLTTKNELFMCKSNRLLPIIQPRKERSFPDELSLPFIHQRSSEKENLKLYNQLFERIQKHDLMPILDLKVVDLSLCLRLCPRMENQKQILDNLSFLHEANELQPLLSGIDPDEIIELLFSYFSYINFALEQHYLKKILSLPLFKDISNTYRSLKGRVYIWPDHVCLSGKDTWMSHIPDYVIFLPPNGSWTKLANASVLGIVNMSPLVFYVEYIFPFFYLLSDQERQEHLKHIRDTPQLFNAALYHSQAENDDNKKNESEKFILKLKQLKCLKKKGQLTCISGFCDPDVIIFGMFAAKDEFPPEAYADQKWLEFFRKIGLRIQADKDEFISFCESVASGSHRHISEGSRILLDYLFKETCWYSDNMFLSQVSQIPFVCAEELHDLACIFSVANVEKIVQQGSKTFRLTSLCKAAARPACNLVWTVKPVVELPRMPFQYPTKDAQAFLMKINVCMKPTYTDVLKNIINLSKSPFAKFELFDVYPETLTQKKGKEHLLCKVLQDCYTHLKKSNCSNEALEPLRDIPCIPVSRNGNEVDRSSPVLVQPLQVIASNSKDFVKLVPFLNPLPTDMYSVLNDVLSKVGVKSDIEVDNIQHALKTIHDNIVPPITADPNTSEVVKQLIKSVYSCLKNKQEVTGVLFLPNEAGMLVESTKLLFNDVERLREACLDLSGSSYSFLSLLSEKLKELNEYGFRSIEFYCILPGSVRPLPLSDNYKEELSDHCKSKEKLSEFATNIRKALEFPDFVEVAKLLMTAFSSMQEECEPLKRFINNLEIFHSSVKVLAVSDLHVDVYLTIVDPPLNTGSVKVDFFLQEVANDDFSLYIDEAVYALKLNLFESLTRAIVSHVHRMGCSKTDFDIQGAEKAIGILLKAPTPNQIEELLNDRGINTAGMELKGAATSKFTPTLGGPIPEDWHHRLFCDIRNVFKPQEWVGYEDRDNHYIFARVEHSVITADSDGEQEQEENRQLNSDERLDHVMITISEDEQGMQQNVTVTVLDLYKILRIKTRPHDDGTTELVLYDPDSESVLLWNAIKDEKLKLILKEICQELKRIWKLKDKDQRRKAIKAMYLKWHPDKNPHPFATKAFQFLRRQIQRLKQGLPLEEPDENTDESQSTFTPDNYWDSYFRNWDNIARSRNRYWRQEQTYYYNWCGGSSSSSYGTSSSSYRCRYNFSFDDVMEDVRVTPDPSTARVWMKQAEHDLKALEILAIEVDTCRGVCAHVCFMAHQVAEKALKAGMYQVSGLHSSALKNHQLMAHANAIVQMRARVTTRLSQNASKLESYYLNPRYPNRYTPVTVPSDQYTVDQAAEAKEAAAKILTIIKTLV